MRPKDHPSPRGFTLVELLVVIALLALMLTLLTPALRGVRSAAVTVQCAANLRSMAGAFTLYQQAHDNYMPAARPAIPARTATGALNWSSVQYPFWQEFLTPYLRPTNGPRGNWAAFFTCPAFGDRGSFAVHNDYTLVGYTDPRSGQKLSFGASAFVAANSGELWEGPLVYTQMARAVSPSRTARVYDGAVESLDGSARTPYPVAPLTANPAVRYGPDGKLVDRADYRHGKARSTQFYVRNGRQFGKYVDGQLNVLFVDGHVETLPAPRNTPADQQRAAEMSRLR